MVEDTVDGQQLQQQEHAAELMQHANDPSEHTADAQSDAILLPKTS